MNGDSATSTADQVRRGTRRAIDVVGEALDRAESSQPVLNAFTRLDRDRALSRAAALDAEIAAGADPGPLAGVPVGLKDLIDEAGLPNTRGAGGFPPLVPTAPAPVVERIEAAGGVIIGRTGLHEFAFGFSSENEWFGPVRNPWDTTLSPGGSSGGSGAAVAAGIVPVSIGTDTGGSVRVPAALCGIAGLKTTHGVVPLEGVFPLAPSLDTVGPLARSVEDLALVFAVLADTDRAAVTPIDQDRRLRIGVPTAWIRPPLDPIVAARFEQLLAELASAGALVVPIEELDAPGEEVMLGAAVEIADIHRADFEAAPERYGADVAERLGASFQVPRSALAAAEAWRNRTLGVLQSRWSDLDALLTPTVAARRKEIGEDEIEIDGLSVFYRGLLSAFTAPVNRLGLPAVALPLPGPSIPPVSVQLIGPQRAETDLLAIGRTLEIRGLVAYGTPDSWFAS